MAAVLLVTADVDSKLGSRVFNILLISTSLVKAPNDWKIFVMATPKERRWILDGWTEEWIDG